jgi:hypothetical protein
MTVAAAYVQLPLDTGNTGKKQRTQSRTIGADTVHETYMVMSSARDYQGVYGGHSGNLTLLAAAQNGTTTGFLWLINLAASTVTLALARLRYASAITTGLALATTPRTIAQLFTYTGTPSGAAITTAKFNSGYPAAQGSLRTAMTGMTITLGGIIDGHLPPTTAGTAGWTFLVPNVDDNIANSELSDINLKTAEGVVIYQADAGTTADTRKLIVDMAWSEYN